MASASALIAPPSVPVPAPLADPATRRRLSRSAISDVLRLAEFWHLTNDETRALLGAIPARSWFRIRDVSWTGTLSPDELTRASLLIGIFLGLREVFSLPLADEWVRLPNRNPLFAGLSPLAIMTAGGIPAMLDVRRLVDALRDGL